MWSRREEALGIRVRGRTEQLERGRVLDDLTGVHDHGSGAEVRHDAEVVRHEENRHSHFLLE